MKTGTDPDDLDSRLPWVVNQTLAPDEQQQVERWLKDHPEKQFELSFWRDIQSVVMQQPRHLPSRHALQAIISSIRLERRSRREKRIRWLYQAAGVALALVVFLFLWSIVKPGIVLQWSVIGHTPTSFRIFRAEVGGDEYRLIAELAAQPGRTEYQFVDLWLIPGKSYVYWIEGGDNTGVFAYSQQVSNSSLSALPGQLGILITSVILGYVIVLSRTDLFRLRKFRSQGGVV